MAYQCDSRGIRCKTSCDSTKQVQWRYYFVECQKHNPLCNPNSGGFVPAITVCTQKLNPCLTTKGDFSKEFDSSFSSCQKG